MQSILLTAARFAAFAATVLIPYMLVRILDQAEFGIYKQAFLLVATLVPFVNLGLNASLYYFVPRDEGDGHRYVVQAVMILSLTGAVAAIGLVTIGGPILRALDMGSVARYTPLLALYMLLLTPGEIVFTLPVIDQRPALAAYAIGGFEVLRTLAVAVAALIFANVSAVLWAMIVTVALRGVFLWLYVRFRRTGPAAATTPRWSEQLGYALPWAVATILEMALLTFHQYFVAAQTDDALFAIYAVGILNIPLFGMLAQSVSEVMIVRSAGAWARGDRAQLRELWLRATERTAAVVLPLWALLEIAAPDLFRTLFPGYDDSIAVFRLFLTANLASIILDHGILRATGDTRYIVRANAIGVAATIVGVIAFGQIDIFRGAIWGYLLGLAVIRALGLYKVRQRIGLAWRESLPFRAMARSLLVAGAASAVSALGLFAPTALLRLMAVSALFAAAFLPLALRFGVLDPAELRRVGLKLLPGTGAT